MDSLIGGERPGVAWRDSARLNGLGLAWEGMAWLVSTARKGLVWSGSACRLGKAWDGKACLSLRRGLARNELIWIGLSLQAWFGEGRNGLDSLIGLARIGAT